VCLALLPQGLYAYDSLSSPVPAVLKVPAGHRPFLQGYATGAQNYICLPSDSGFAWVFFGPQATLFNNDETQIITHFLSPNPKEGDMPRATWQDSRDSSAVWAKMIASYPAPTVAEPQAIPWLLLEVVGSDFGPTWGHRLTETTHIQRVHTSGGLAPTTGCVQAQDVGTAINPMAVEGQIEGGAVQGIGRALSEEVVIREGELLNPSLTTYLMPLAVDMPAIENALVEVPTDEGPFGARAVAEPPTSIERSPSRRNPVSSKRISEKPVFSRRLLSNFSICLGLSACSTPLRTPL